MVQESIRALLLTQESQASPLWHSGSERSLFHTMAVRGRRVAAREVSIVNAKLEVCHFRVDFNVGAYSISNSRTNPPDNCALEILSLALLITRASSVLGSLRAETGSIQNRPALLLGIVQPSRG